MTEARTHSHREIVIFTVIIVGGNRTEQNGMNETSYTLSHFALLILLFMYDKCLIFLKPSQKQKHGNYECFRAFSAKHEKVQRILAIGRGRGDEMGDKVSFQVKRFKIVSFILLNGANRFTNFGICALTEWVSPILLLIPTHFAHT